MVTSELIPAAPLAEGESVTVNLAAGRTFEIPLEVSAGETLSILTSTHDFYDSILVLLAPDGTPVLGADDYLFYFAGFEWMAEQTGTYRMLVTSFEAVNTGELYVSRQ
jgi:hypothetical protein